MENIGQDLLDRFGTIFATRFDATLRQVKVNIERTYRPIHRKDTALRQFLESKSEDERALKIARYAMQMFAHALFDILDEGDVYSLVAKMGDGRSIDLKEYSDLLSEETNIWCETYSEYGSVTNDLLDVAERLS